MRQIQDNLDREPTSITFDASIPAFVSVALGSAYFRAERLVDAEREYKAAIEVDDRAGEAHNNLAVVYMMTDRFEQSEREMKLAEKSGFPVNPGLKQDLADRRRQKP
jgi:Flp pilus assembly protein TadD